MRRFLLGVVLLCSFGCAGTLQRSPAGIAHYGTDAVKILTTFQTAVIAESTAGLPLDQTKPIMDWIYQNLLVAQQLSAALDVYEKTKANLTALLQIVDTLRGNLEGLKTGTPTKLLRPTAEVIDKTDHNLDALRTEIKNPAPVNGCRIVGKTAAGYVLECPATILPPGARP